ncbi:MAG: MBL fold metallo-hydrolase [Caldilinea sp.]|nr:MBL fold metallo-hydrolase [Caldilinea sp.]
MNITFLGGADEVGASSILIEIGGRRLLVDAGIRPTPKARWGLAGDQLPDLEQIARSGGIDAILVTHAHTDHTGALELVVERYPHVPVYATPVTIELTRVLHQDARRIMQMRLDEEGELPLFDEVATARLMSAFKPVQFNQPISLAPGLTATYFLAGHIAGAAMIGLSSSEGRILISGDISISPQRTVDGARPPSFAPDVLILESTYGGRLHANRHAEERRLVETIAEVTAEGGKVLIPAFALGRAQEILLTLGEYQRRGELAAVPVWADGMVRAICQAYSSFPDALPLALQEQGATFYTERIQPVASAAQRNALVWEPGAAVIVASSGMLAGGPSLAYARALAGQPQHAILLTGYQDEEAPGRRLQEMAQRGRGTLRLGRDRIDVQARLATYSLSAHADTGQLVSFVETLDPAQTFLVHGDEDARHSLADALRNRGRAVRLPRAGQGFDFTFTPAVRPAQMHGIGQGRPVDLQRLWHALQRGDDSPAAADTLITLDEMARLWWGERPGATQAQRAGLAAALAADDRFFAPDRGRVDVYRIRSRAQVELAQRRQAQLNALGDLHGRWLLARDASGEVHVAQVVSVAADHVTVQTNDDAVGEPLTVVVWPEEILSLLDDAADGAAALARMAGTLAAAPGAAPMEPNQALAVANAHFPPDARLRRAGYRLADHVLTLTFDFPDVVRSDFAAELEALAVQTDWHVELAPEANQSALTLLVSELLPAGLSVVKGPSIFRAERRVTVTVALPANPDDDPDDAVWDAVEARYAEVSGYALAITLVEATPQSTARANAGGDPLEINAAYAVLKQRLAGSTLYRTSLKDGAIVLSFISPQVGERHRAAIETLAQEIGWPLSINPQPNQGAIVDAARLRCQQQGWTIAKGPSIYLDRGEVSVTVAAAVDAEDLAALQDAFSEETGFRLLVNSPAAAAPAPAASTVPPVEIAVAQVRLTHTQQGLTLNPAKLDHAIQRAQRDGRIAPPIVVRRVRDGYLLLDGLYRLRAAQAIGMERIAATVEG